MFDSEICKDMRSSTRYMRDHYPSDKPLKCVEIGVKSGTNSKSILETLNVGILYMVDPYIKYNSRTTNRIREFFFVMKKEVLEVYPDKCVFINKTSDKATEDIPDDLDFVYIDGNHSRYWVNQDIDNYYPKLKVGGVLAGHDYTSKKHSSVRGAVDAFVFDEGLELHTGWNEFPTKHKAETDWWVIKK